MTYLPVIEIIRSGTPLLYVTQTKPMIDAVRAKKDRFRMETKEKWPFFVDKPEQKPQSYQIKPSYMADVQRMAGRVDGFTPSHLSASSFYLI